MVQLDVYVAGYMLTSVDGGGIVVGNKMYGFGRQGSTQCGYIHGSQYLQIKKERLCQR